MAICVSLCRDHSVYAASVTPSLIGWVHTQNNPCIMCCFCLQPSRPVPRRSTTTAVPRVPGPTSCLPATPTAARACVPAPSTRWLPSCRTTGYLPYTTASREILNQMANGDVLGQQCGCRCAILDTKASIKILHGWKNVLFWRNCRHWLRR